MSPKAVSKKKGKSFRARVTVMPRPVILDPQGKAIGDALGRLGFDQVGDVRAGKSFAIVLDAASPAAAEKALGEMCDKLLANPVVEDYAIEVLGPVDEAAPAEKAS